MTFSAVRTGGPLGQPGEPVPQYGYQVPGDFGSPQPAFAGPESSFPA